MTFRDALAQLFKARFPVLYIETFEEQQVLAEITAVACDIERVRTPRTIVTWSCTEGLVDQTGAAVAESTNPARALRVVLQAEQPTVAVFRDLHMVLGDGTRPPDPQVVRLICDIAAAFKDGPVAEC